MSEPISRPYKVFLKLVGAYETPWVIEDTDGKRVLCRTVRINVPSYTYFTVENPEASKPKVSGYIYTIGRLTVSDQVGTIF